MSIKKKYSNALPSRKKKQLLSTKNKKKRDEQNKEASIIPMNNPKKRKAAMSREIKKTSMHEEKGVFLEEKKGLGM